TVHAQQVTINGAGATFPFPLIDTWRVEYQKVKPDVNINYASIGSGGEIKQLNSGVNLPSNPITVVHRSDGSGTTNVFTDYLSKVSPEWKSKVGTSKSVQWPVGVGAPGNEGVAASIGGSKYSIGYV